MKVTVIGGGAAGFFAAINIAEKVPGAEIQILEKSSKVLGKVKVSGGGRCNVTHACFDPAELVLNYPRGKNEMIGPFHKFQPGDTMAWFEERKVELKIEEDNRIFPVSDSSDTIIHCFREAARQLGIKVLMKHGVTNLESTVEGWKLELTTGESFMTDKVIMSPGSSNQMWKLLGKLGHTIVEPVPSLFTFKCTDSRISELAGVVAPHATVKVKGSKLESDGPLLITHWGFSAPSILKLSAWGARELHDLKYDFTLEINWDDRFEVHSMIENLKTLRQEQGKRNVLKINPTNLPNRLWQRLVEKSINANQNWGDLSNAQIEKLSNEICAGNFSIKGKSTFKEEFVTAGGVALEEVDFQTMESKILPGLYFSGEILNIDAVTGGFNFQAAWTESWIISEGFLSVRN